jgi:hypothetical protein
MVVFWISEKVQKSLITLIRDDYIDRKVIEKSTHSTPRSEARGMLRVDTEPRFLPQFKNGSLAASNVSIKSIYCFMAATSPSCNKNTNETSSPSMGEGEGGGE